MTKKYQPKYEHDAHKIAFTDFGKRGSTPEKKAERKAYAELVSKYNLNYDLFLCGKKTREVLKSLDNLQEQINGKTN
jgi:hypothetical protein